MTIAPQQAGLKTALIVFDIDGTLLQTELVTTPAVQRTFARYGLPVPSAEAIHDTFGRPVEEYWAWLESLCPDGNAREIVDATNRLELELVAAEGRLYPNVLEVLEGLKRDGHALAICSNGPDDYVDAVLDGHDLRRRFDLIRTRGTKYSGKPEMIAEILRLIDARPAFVVGDRVDDIEAAHAHGATAIAADYGFGSAGELCNADAHAANATEIPGLITHFLGMGI